VTAVDDVTVPVGMVNVTAADPAGTMTIDGGEAAVVSDERTWTASVPDGTTFETVRVPVTGVPALTLVGSTAKPVTKIPRIVSAASALPPPADAVMWAMALGTMIDVLTVNVAVVAPPATVTDGGGLAADESLESVTTVPPDGAAPFSVTVPMLDPPPAKLEGDSERVATAGGRTVRLVDFVTPPPVA
jgi:hypothetical protein